MCVRHTTEKTHSSDRMSELGCTLCHRNPLMHLYGFSFSAYWSWKRCSTSQGFELNAVLVLHFVCFLYILMIYKGGQAHSGEGRALHLQTFLFWSRSFLSSPTLHFLFLFLHCAVKISTGVLKAVIMLRLCVCVTVCVCVCVLGVNSLCQSLSANPSIPSSLVHLDLSGNMLRGDDMQVYYTEDVWKR